MELLGGKKMDDTSKQQQDWAELCREIAEEHAPPSEKFVSNVFKSAEQQRQIRVETMAQELQMLNTQEQIKLGLEALFAMILDPGEMELIVQMLEQMGETLGGQRPLVRPDNADGASTTIAGENLAMSLSLQKEALELIEKVALLYMGKEAWKEAIGIFTFLALLESGNANHWFRRALALHFLGYIQKAMDSIEAALALNPQQPEFYILRAAIEVSQQLAAAKESLKSAEELVAAYALVLPTEWEQWKNQLKLEAIYK